MHRKRQDRVFRSTLPGCRHGSCSGARCGTQHHQSAERSQHGTDCRRSNTAAGGNGLGKAKGEECRHRNRRPDRAMGLRSARRDRIRRFSRWHRVKRKREVGRIGCDARRRADGNTANPGKSSAGTSAQPKPQSVVSFATGWAQATSCNASASLTQGRWQACKSVGITRQPRSIRRRTRRSASIYRGPFSTSTGAWRAERYRLSWRPQGDSNPRYRRERAMS